MLYLAAAYAVFWLVTFIFVYTIVSRQQKLQKELEILEQIAQDDSTPLVD